MRARPCWFGCEEESDLKEAIAQAAMPRRPSAFGHRFATQSNNAKASKLSRDRIGNHPGHSRGATSPAL